MEREREKGKMIGCGGGSRSRGERRKGTKGREAIITSLIITTRIQIN